MTPENPFSLRDKKIVITGASSGIGRQCAIDCSAMGASVVLIGRNEERLEETRQKLCGSDHLVLPFDLSQTDSIKETVSAIVEKRGKIDGFIHSAGIEKTVPVKFLQPSVYEEIFKTNALSAFEFIRQFGNIKNFNKGGSIVMISSITSVIARGGVAAYAASKGAMNSAMRVMAVEFAPKGIRVNCISPGTIMTPMMSEYMATLSDEEKANRLNGFPLGLGQPNDISNACIYLLSDASRWVTGQNLIVDGGYTVL